MPGSSMPQMEAKFHVMVLQSVKSVLMKEHSILPLSLLMSNSPYLGPTSWQDFTLPQTTATRSSSTSLMAQQYRWLRIEKTEPTASITSTKLTKRETHSMTCLTVSPHYLHPRSLLLRYLMASSIEFPPIAGQSSQKLENSILRNWPSQSRSLKNLSNWEFAIAAKANGRHL